MLPTLLRESNQGEGGEGRERGGRLVCSHSDPLPAGTRVAGDIAACVCIHTD